MLGHAGLGQPNLAALGIGLVTPSQDIAAGLLTNTQTFFAPVLANEAAQNLDVALFNEGDVFYVPDIVVDALPNQILVAHFDDPDLFYAPLLAFEAAQNINVGLFVDADTFYAPTVFAEGTLLNITVGHLANPNEFLAPTIVQADKEPVYTYPTGRGLYSDYGIRASMTFYKRRMIIGRR